MSKQMHEILKQYEERQDKYANLSQEHKLQVNSTKSSSSKVCCHLAVLRDSFPKFIPFVSVRMIQPFFAFIKCSRKQCLLGPVLKKSEQNLQYFLNSKFLVILTIFLKKIWPLLGLFSFLRIWPFLKLLKAKFGLFYFLGPGIPETACRNKLL